MAYGICRIQKLKAGSLGGSGRHTNRERYTPNADPTKQHIRIIGEPDSINTPNLETIVREKIGNQTIRKNAVMAVEFLLTASPEYFRPDDPGRAGYYHQQRLEDFQKKACEWLINSYGDRIVRAELHLDESTPHIHAYMVPLDEKGKLNCRALLGGSRHRLSELQDSFAQAVAPLGLERGIKGSLAKHTRIQQYYSAINKAPDINLDSETMKQQVADRQRALKKSAVMEKTASHLAQENQQLQLQLSIALAEAKKQKQEAVNWQKKYQDLANTVRDFPLAEVAYQLGLEPDPKDKHKWHNTEHIINITGSKFYDWKALKGGGGSIDLVMHVNQYDFKQAVTWLNDRLGEGAMLEATRYYAKEVVLTQPVPLFTPPVVDAEKWQQVRNYLRTERQLPSSLVDALHEQGLIYADNKQNAVFLRRSLDGQTITGASLRGTAGTNNNFKGLARGSKRSDGWFYFLRGGQSSDPVQRAVLVESAIDAMSIAVLERTDSRQTVYLSTDGAGHIPVDFLRALPAKSVIVAYDHDAAGLELAQKVMSVLPNSVCKVPNAKDWNEELKNYLNFEQQQQQRRQQQPRKQQHRGFSL
ncbi:plasmid recombination enzyme (plasmid) [Nostoc sp. HK-01]|nr:plasmid recombination enzyme [Nostoc sp. HK-01]